MSEYVYCAGCGQPLVALDEESSETQLGHASDCPDTGGDSA